jgi:hypothetical protein
VTPIPADDGIDWSGDAWLERFPIRGERVDDQEHLVFHDAEGKPMRSLPAHRLDQEPNRHARKVWFWISAAALLYTYHHAHTWSGWVYETGALALPILIVYAGSYAVYSVWDRIAWRFELGPRRRDSFGARWRLEETRTPF